MTPADDGSTFTLRRVQAMLGLSDRLQLLEPGESVTLPDAPYLHLFVARGDVTLEGAGALAAGDAVRFTATGGQRLAASAPAEILVWEMHATLAAA